MLLTIRQLQLSEYMLVRKSDYWPEHVIPQYARWCCTHFNQWQQSHLRLISLRHQLLRHSRKMPYQVAKSFPKMAPFLLDLNSKSLTLLKNKKSNALLNHYRVSPTCNWLWRTATAKSKPPHLKNSGINKSSGNILPSSSTAVFDVN